MNTIVYGNELAHHGIRGQKWGVRRYQNYDGTRTAAGRARRYAYEDMSNLSDQEVQAKLNRARNELQYHQTMKQLRDERDGYRDISDYTKDAQNEINYYQTMRKLDAEREGRAESREKVQQAVKDLATVVAVTGSVIALATNGSKIVNGVMKTAKNVKVAAGK